MYNKRNTYICKICKEGFRTKKNYNNHMKYMHQIVEVKNDFNRNI